MRDTARARRALERADQERDEIGRSVWLAKAADHAVSSQAVLVGGAAVNLHTGSYRPTDVDMCACLSESDREALKDVGFEQRQGDHFAYAFSDGERWLIEFPDSQVDGGVTLIRLDDREVLAVISLESLILDRIIQATDRTSITFEEAVRLCVAVLKRADWRQVAAEVQERSSLAPGLRLAETHERVIASAQSLA